MPFDVVFTERAGHATLLAREGAARYECVVAVGGDGTTNEVVNGLVDDNGPLRPELRLGIIPRGTGADFPRTLGIPHHLEDAAARLAQGNVREVDLAKVHFRDFAGQETVPLLHQRGRDRAGPRRLPGSGPQLQAAGSPFHLHLGSLGRHASLPRPLGHPHSGQRRAVAHPPQQRVGGQRPVLGQRHPHGAPRPPGRRPPGRGGRSLTRRFIQRISLLRKLRSGDFTDQPGVTYKTARRVEARSEETTLIEVEGEPIGMLPATFEMTGNRLKVVA